MTPCWLLVLLCSSPLWQTEGVEGWGISTVPSESECRPYIEKALKEQSPETPQEAVDTTGSDHETPPSPSTEQEGSIEETEEATAKESIDGETGDEAQTQTEGESAETAEGSNEDVPKAETETASGEEVVSTEESAASTEATESQEAAPEESIGEDAKGEESSETEEVEETTGDQQVPEAGEESAETNENSETTSTEGAEELGGEQSAETLDEGTTEDKTEEEEAQSLEETQESIEKEGESLTEAEEQNEETNEEGETGEEISTEHTQEDTTESEEKTETTDDTVSSTEEHATSEEEAENTGGEVVDSPETAESAETQEDETTESAEAGAGEVVTESIEETAETTEASTEEAAPASEEENAEDVTPSSAEEPSEATTENTEDGTEEGSAEETKESVEGAETDSSVEAPSEDNAEASGETETSEAEEQPIEETPVEAEVAETIQATPTSEVAPESEQESTEQTEEQEQPTKEGEVVKERAATVEDQLSLEFEVPKVRRQREHIAEILKLTPESVEVEMLLAKTIESTLKELKKLYDSAIKPLEILYKYRDLSNRHFGDPEIFSKPLILFMGPWSGGKSSIINYLLDNEFQGSSLRTGAEPSPAYFNILMWGEREEVLDGTQLAADWTFSGLQKFGQGLLDRLRGLKLNHSLLEKVNIVEIPGILEIRKQVERLFPFNDACQWFIDRADIIFLVYDPSKLDVGPETEAILDQLKGREYQTRILLNKADQVKPEELMRVQGTLIWNISPLMSSQEPPILYSTSLWSVPYEQGAPTRLLHAQERAFLRDLRAAVDKRVENKIASARRFAVRVRNHAKMVDCYLTTYYNHKTFFGNRKKVADDIIEHPQNYHIYEGLSTLTNISRYDLPDPEVYRDFFRLNPVYDFQRLSDTCTYFRGCPINRLDVAIAYDLPELVGKYKKQAERVLEAKTAQAPKS